MDFEGFRHTLKTLFHFLFQFQRDTQKSRVTTLHIIPLPTQRQPSKIQRLSDLFEGN